MLNLRGIIVPIIDMRIRLKLGAALNTDYLIGLGTVERRMLILVDIDRLMSDTDPGLIEKLAA